MVWVTRAPDEKFLEKNLKPFFKSRQTSISVWACFCGREIGPVVVLPDGEKMNQHLYTDLILKRYFIPFYYRMSRKYRTRNNPVYIQEDRASYHTAKIPTEYQLKIKVKSLDWPPQSPDLAPIKNL